MTSLNVHCYLANPAESKKPSSLAEGSLLRVSCAIAPLLPSILELPTGHVLIESLLKQVFEASKVTSTSQSDVYKQVWDPETGQYRTVCCESNLIEVALTPAVAIMTEYPRPVSPLE